MDTNPLKGRLEQAMRSSNYSDELESLIDELAESGAGLECIRPVLELMEEHPHVDFGSPGPLVHLVERFYGCGYESELLASLGRRPTVHTVWMLNRVINGPRGADHRKTLLEALEAAGHHPSADDETRALVKRFVGRSSS